LTGVIATYTNHEIDLHLEFHKKKPIDGGDERPVFTIELRHEHGRLCCRRFRLRPQAELWWRSMCKVLDEFGAEANNIGRDAFIRAVQQFCKGAGH
jgi:hypothetical protein